MADADYTFRKKIQIRYVYFYTHTRVLRLKSAAADISNNIVNDISASRYAFYAIVNVQRTFLPTNKTVSRIIVYTADIYLLRAHKIDFGL